MDTKECINNTYDQVYNYKKVTKIDSFNESIEYFIQSKNPLYQDPMFGQPTLLGGGYVSIRSVTYPDANSRELVNTLIAQNINFNCVFTSPLQTQIDPELNESTKLFVSTTPPISPIPSNSKISNIIEDFNNTPKLLTGVVLDYKSNLPIEKAEISYNEEKIYTKKDGTFETEVKPSLIPEVDRSLDYDNNPYSFKLFTHQTNPDDVSTMFYYAKIYFNIKHPDFGKVLINEGLGFEQYYLYDTDGNLINNYNDSQGNVSNLTAEQALKDEIKYLTEQIGLAITSYSNYKLPSTTEQELQFLKDLNSKGFYDSPPLFNTLIGNYDPNDFYTANVQDNGFKAIFIFNKNKEIPNLEELNTNITIKFKDYSSQTIPLANLNGELKNNVGVVYLKSTKVDLDKEKLDSLLPKKEELQEALKDQKDFRFFANKKLLDILNNLKTVMTPIILTWLSEFGVTKLNEIKGKGKEKLEEKICPNIDKIKEIIKRKNKLVKQLNNTQKLINSTLKSIGAVQTFIDISLGLIKGIDAAQLFLPTSLPGVTAGTVNKLDDAIEFIDDKAKIGKKSISGLLVSINLLRITITQIITYLNLLDNLILDCYPDNEIEQENLSQELISLTQNQSQQLSPVVVNVNGFEMGVETEKTNNTLKRRRAIARNKQGIIMLKGEYSFSSIDQILIDELVFYIQQNDLKAD